MCPGPPDHELTASQIVILKQAMNKVRETVQRLATDHRDLHSTVSKVGKAIDRVSNEAIPSWVDQGPLERPLEFRKLFFTYNFALNKQQHSP